MQMTGAIPAEEVKGTALQMGGRVIQVKKQDSRRDRQAHRRRQTSGINAVKEEIHTEG